jgi:tetratricopeptide (TPR) repeat protein
MERERKMLRKLLLLSMVSVLIVAVIPLITDSGTSVSAHRGIQLASPTPNASTVVNNANDALSHAQDILNIISVFATILGVVLGLFALVVAALTFLGIRSYREVNDLAKNLRTNLESIQKEADRTRQALVYIGLGDRLLSQKYTSEALENYKKAGSLLPNDPQINYVLGRIYSSAGDYDAAIAALEASRPEQLIEQAKVLKELGLSYRRRGEALKQNADYDEAIKLLKKAIVLNPDDADTLAIIGGLYRRKKEYIQALDFYERAWRANPGLSYALGNLASLSWFLGNVSDALKYFGFTEVAAAGRIKKGQSEGFWDHYDLALAHLATGKIPEAKEAYTKAIQETPGNVQFDSVLNNLYLLQQAPHAMPGLDEVVKMIEDAKVE